MLLSLSFLLIIAAMWNGNVLHSAVWYQSAMYRTEVSTAKKNGESSASWNEREEELNVQRLKLRKCNLFLFEPSTVYKRYYFTSPLVREASFDPVGMVTMIAVWQNLFEVCFHGTVVKRWDPFCTFFLFYNRFLRRMSTNLFCMSQEYSLRCRTEASRSLRSSSVCLLRAFIYVYGLLQVVAVFIVSHFLFLKKLCSCFKKLCSLSSSRYDVRYGSFLRISEPIRS